MLLLASAAAEGAGHGGMDFFVVHAFVEAPKAQASMPIDICDAVAWSAVTPLSEQSIAEGFKTLAFPDFTGLARTFSRMTTAVVE